MNLFEIAQASTPTTDNRAHVAAVVSAADERFVAGLAVMAANLGVRLDVVS